MNTWLVRRLRNVHQQGQCGLVGSVETHTVVEMTGAVERLGGWVREESFVEVLIERLRRIWPLRELL